MSIDRRPSRTGPRIVKCLLSMCARNILELLECAILNEDLLCSMVPGVCTRVPPGLIGMSLCALVLSRVICLLFYFGFYYSSYCIVVFVYLYA